MIQSPGIILRAQPGVGQSGSNSKLVDQLIERLRKNRPEWNRPIQFELIEQIPAHQGLGSGTQLGMAVTEAMASFHGETNLTPRQLASYSRRGQRSSVGLHGYLDGGFLVDAGHQQGEAIGQLACHVPFPDDWRIILVTPPEEIGIHGDDETLTFSKLSPMSPSRTGELCRLTLTEILPALKYADFGPFVRAIQKYGELVGEFFASVQGGIFAQENLEPFVERLLELGVQGIAQSSWGPTIAIFARNDSEADHILNLVRADEFGSHCTSQKTEALNRGRLVSTPTD